MKAIKTRDVVKFLKAQGWTILRQRGPHDIWTNADGTKTLALPRHTETAPGILRQIKKLEPNTPDNWK